MVVLIREIERRSALEFGPEVQPGQGASEGRILGILSLSGKNERS